VHVILCSCPATLLPGGMALSYASTAWSAVGAAPEVLVVSHRDTQRLSPDHEAVLALLGATIQHHRQQQGLSQRTLAAHTGLSHTYISQIEQGKRNPTILSLRSIADALHISLCLLIAPLDPFPGAAAPPAVNPG
jgi:DNA-binding XRE family transcriptional regulator